MQTNILWSGIEYYSLENCVVEVKSHSVTINSVILGLYNDTIYRIDYSLKLNEIWETNYCLIKSQLDDEIKTTEFSKIGDKWSTNGKHYPEFDDCTEVDIPLTPLTNSLPINRLNLTENQEQVINVIYIDLLEHRIRHVKQKYRRISSELYKYENIPNDFEAEIKVDEAGFVIDYPQLFKRTLRMPSAYLLGLKEV